MKTTKSYVLLIILIFMFELPVGKSQIVIEGQCCETMIPLGNSLVYGGACVPVPVYVPIVGIIGWLCEGDCDITLLYGGDQCTAASSGQETICYGPILVNQLAQDFTGSCPSGMSSGSTMPGCSCVPGAPVNPPYVTGSKIPTYQCLN